MIKKFLSPRVRIVVVLTVLAISVYRVAFYVPSPGIDRSQLNAAGGEWASLVESNWKDA